MNVATVAMDTVWKESKKNIEQTERHVGEVMQRWPKTEIILFPEISLMGFVTDPSNVDVAETMDGYCVSEVKRIAKKHKVALICGFIEQNNGQKPFNTCFVVDKNGELLASYRKNHLFTESPEHLFFSAGTELKTFDFEGWKCGLATCFDIRFPRLFETYRKAGVELILMPFNWIRGRNKPAIMEALVRARAHENQYFFAAVDRTGSDTYTTYYGKSVISNPYCEDVATHDGIYSYAEIAKDDIAALGKALPLVGSFREQYIIRG